MTRTKCRMYRLLPLMLILVALLAGCKAGKEAEGPDSQIVLDLEDTAYAIADAAGFEITYNADAGFLQKTYGFEEGSVSGFKALFGTMIDANRLLLFETKTKAQRETANKMAGTIKKQLGESFTAEMTEQKSLADAAVVVEKGNYVLFLSGVNTEAGVKVFEAMFTPAEVETEISIVTEAEAGVETETVIE